MEFLKQRIVDFGQKRANLIGAGKHPAKARVRVASVATELRLRRFLQHDDSRRARLSRRHRRFEGGAAATDNYNRDVFTSHSRNLQ